MNQPLISVLIPVYNAGSYLRPSVLSVLGQTHEHLEVIIIDDGSTDGCVATIKDLTDPRLRHLKQTNQGKPVALNAALAVAQGEFYAIHDADDISYPRRFEVLSAYLMRNPAVAAVFSGHDLRLGDRVFAPRFAAKDCEACHRDIEAMRMPAHDPTVMYRRSLVKALAYDPDLPIVEGFDHILRVGELHPMAVLGDCLYSYRIHASSLTSRNHKRNNVMVQKVLKKASARRQVPFAADRYPSSSDQPSRDPLGLVTQSMESVLDYRGIGRRMAALRVALDCWLFRPWDPFYLKPLVYWLVPLTKIHSRRRKRGGFVQPGHTAVDDQGASGKQPDIRAA